ncbi:hypothetical protein LC76P1_00030 [Lysinibacillus phage LC76P1]|nr:hypothetical protein LC76P1_00030 [Lysinibacillus phage LC76P1]
MSKFILLCGLPASGKSKISEQLAVKYNAKVFSSDEIRKELTGTYEDQSKNGKVFDILHKRIKDALIAGENVIYDATNINKKRRIHMINQEFVADEFICYYMVTPVLNCIVRDLMREKSVGDSIINRMYKDLQVPFYDEGWNHIEYMYASNVSEGSEASREIFLQNIKAKAGSHDELFEYLSDVSEHFANIFNMPQDSKYHSFSVSRHTFEVFNYVNKNFPEDDLILASLFHDIGKFATKSFFNYNGVEKKYASFIGHENVSAQLSMIIMRRLGFDMSQIYRVARLVQYHMMPLNASEKVNKRLRTWLNKSEYEQLMNLHEADQAGH